MGKPPARRPTYEPVPPPSTAVRENLLRNAELPDALKTALDELEKVLADFTWQRGNKSGPHADDVQRVNAAILKATQAVGKL